MLNLNPKLVLPRELYAGVLRRRGSGSGAPPVGPPRRTRQCRPAAHAQARDARPVPRTTTASYSGRTYTLTPRGWLCHCLVVRQGRRGHPNPTSATYTHTQRTMAGGHRRRTLIESSFCAHTNLAVRGASVLLLSSSTHGAPWLWPPGTAS